MDQGFRLFPQQASTMAHQVDYLYFYLVAIATFFTALIFIAIVYMSIRYRRREGAPPPPETRTDYRLEMAWTIIPFLIVMSIFGWSARLYIRMSGAPDDAMDIHVIGKQWMWKIEHPSGAREINELHVPIGKPVKLIMSSQDVIHSFFIPDFRIKQDVVPGRFSTMWFQATRPGEYHLFCAEYCGTDHSRMIGRVVVMEPADYEAWASGVRPNESPVAAGERLYQTMGCSACHSTNGAVAPVLTGLFGSTVQLDGGASVVADEQYIRESMMKPAAQIVKGYQPVMPSFQGQLSEEQIMQIISYIKSLRSEKSTEVSP